MDLLEVYYNLLMSEIDKNKISKLLGVFLLIVAAKFLYEYSKL